MTFEEWVKRLETMIGEPAKSFSIKENEYVCTFRGRKPRKAKPNELKDVYPFYCLLHFYYNQTYTQIFVNKTDFIQIIWNRKGKNIREVEFIFNLRPCSKTNFSEASLNHEEVLNWVYDYYVLNAKNSLEIISRYK